MLVIPVFRASTLYHCCWLQIKRTEGVSTTDIVGRMLTCTRVNHMLSKEHEENGHPLTRSFSAAHRRDESSSDDDASLSPADKEQHRLARKLRRRHVSVSRFLPTSRRLVQFSEGKSAPEHATLVYIDGAFDVFHPGHVEILKVGGDSGGW